MIGRTLGHYRILEQLGAGGMGEVYRAHDERLDRDVALKVLPAGTLADETARSRFRREAVTLSQLNHPNIAVVHDFDTQDGVDFLAMEYVAGETLAAKLAAGPLPEKGVMALGTQIAEALEEAHEREIIHRDLKPGNVMVTPKGRVKVLDFGLAKLVRPVEKDGATASLAETQAGAVMGTVPYMAPEQLQGKVVDARTDIYALGAVLYEMGTGQRPFSQTQSAQLIASILTQPPQPPREVNGQVSPGLEAIILKALEKDPARRYQSAKDLLADLHELILTGSVAVARRRVLRRRWVLAAGVVGLVALVAIVVGLNVGGLRERLRAGGGPPKIESLAVLPLENLSRDPEQEYFADGMTEELITNLAKISALKVISRTSVMHYKGTQKTVPEIAKELRVDAVVEGSVQREGGQVRITAQLIQAATDQHLWAESYERDLRDVLALQTEVARAIADEVRVKLTSQEQAQLAGARPVDPETYELYLKGRYHWNKRTENEAKKSIEYFEQAIAKDPKYAQAYSGLADAHIILNLRGYVSPREANLRAEAAATKALELDDTLAEAHTSLARARANDWDWFAAEREFKRALELNPGSVETHHGHSHYLTAVGRTAESLAESKRALELAPLDPTMNEHLAWHYLFARQSDLSIEQNRKTLELDPNNPLVHLELGEAYEQKSMYAQAIAEFQKAIAVSPRANPEMLTGLGHAYAVAGRSGAALKVLNELGTLSKQRYISPVYMALIEAGLGEKDRAFTWLEKAYQAHAAYLVYLKVEPRLDPLRSDPRFQALLRRMNFPP